MPQGRTRRAHCTSVSGGVTQTLPVSPRAARKALSGITKAWGPQLQMYDEQSMEGPAAEGVFDAAGRRRRARVPRTKVSRRQLSLHLELGPLLNAGEALSDDELINYLMTHVPGVDEGFLVAEASDPKSRLELYNIARNLSLALSGKSPASSPAEEGKRTAPSPSPSTARERASNGRFVPRAPSTGSAASGRAYFSPKQR